MWSVWCGQYDRCGLRGPFGLRDRWGPRGLSGQRCRRLLVVFLVLVGVTGCAVRLAYNQLDWVIPWYLKDYMALEGAQKDRFQQRVDDYLYWHRVDQLPRYATFLNQIAVQAKDGLDRNEIAVIQTQTEGFANTLISEMTPHLIALFASATDGQIHQLFKRFAKDADDFREENIDISERAKRKQAADEARRYVERWVGGLTDKQDDVIRQWSLDYLPMGEEMLAARLAWQQRFKEILALRQHQPQAFEQQLSALLRDSQYGRSAEFDRKLAHNSESLITLYQALDASLSAAQRKHLIHQLNRYAEDFVVLSKQAVKKNG